mmetsp:Transcript_24095/g.35522  ORF Transcript_24095/g.35522 Transcript_24095/m.35522 type:complete len:88 (-) Transcript_24095:362-625(-)
MDSGKRWMPRAAYGKRSGSRSVQETRVAGLGDVANGSMNHEVHVVGQKLEMAILDYHHRCWDNLLNRTVGLLFSRLLRHQHHHLLTS